MPPTGPQLVHAIKRNFGGLQDENIDPEKKFRDYLPKNIDESPDLKSIPPEVSSTYLFQLLGCVICTLYSSLIPRPCRGQGNVPSSCAALVWGFLCMPCADLAICKS